MQIPFPTSSNPGARPGEGSGRLVNIYAFKDGDAVLYGPAPGLVPFATVGSAGRGALLVGSTLYVAVAEQLVRVSSSGSVETDGELSGSGLVTMARNNRIPSPDIVVVNGDGAFHTTGAGLSDYPDDDVGSPNSVAFLDGYFLFTYGDGTIRATGLNTTDLNAESFTKAESKPDGLLRGIVKDRQFIALGPSSTEFYDNAGTSPFPLSRSEVVDVGLYGPWAVAGFEDGWDKEWFTVAADRTVRRWSGYSATIISTRDVERAIASVRNPGALTANVYTFGGTSVLSLSGPDWTWEYHVNIGEWFERESHELKRWRARTTVFAFGRWLCGDLKSDALMAVAEGVRLEGSEPLRCVGEGFLASFPSGARLDNLRLDFSTGQGREDGTDPTETDPGVLVSWSLDGGGHWGTPVRRALGRQGDYDAVVNVSSLGRARHKGVKVRWEVSDPVGFAFRSADIGRVGRRKD